MADQTSRLLSDDALAGLRRVLTGATADELFGHIEALTAERDDAQEALYFSDAGEQMERDRADRLAVALAEMREAASAYLQDSRPCAMTEIGVRAGREARHVLAAILVTDPDARGASILAAVESLVAEDDEQSIPGVLAGVMRLADAYRGRAGVRRVPSGGTGEA